MVNPNMDQSLYSRKLSSATRFMSDALTARYEALLSQHPSADQKGDYGLRRTLREKLAWLEERDA